MNGKRVQFIDIAKGIAMICIILGHLGIANINRVVFTFHVPIFFFITGYFINKKRSIGNFIKIKFRTLIVPYILTCIVIILLGTLQGWMRGNWFTTLKIWCLASLYGAGDTYQEPFYIPGIGAIWFLLATFWGSIFLRISLNFNKYLRIAFIVIIFCIGYYSRSICWFPLSVQAGACATLFMYMGFLLKSMKGIIKYVPQEVKISGIIFAATTWFFFMKDFQSFWLVHCDIGRGIIDIFGCICACIVVIYISKFIDYKLKFVGNFFAYFGKYSLLVLCVHIVELDLLHWKVLSAKLVQYGMPDSWQMGSIILGKMLLDLSCAYILSKISFVKRLYGMRE